jgi:hypothetical protein
MKILSRIKKNIVNSLVGTYAPFALRTFFNTIAYVQFTEIKKSASFLEKHLKDVALFDNKKGGYWNFCMNSVIENQCKGLWLEFGVRDGISAEFFAKYASEFAIDRRLYGFDSFEGIKDSWSSVNEPKGSFSRQGKIPSKIPNCDFIVGWIEDTLEPFLNTHTERISFIHFDLDVYSPTKFALSRIVDKLHVGAIVLFDEFHGYPGWEFNEKKALEETLDPLKYKFIAFSRKQAAIQIL